MFRLINWIVFYQRVKTLGTFSEHVFPYLKFLSSLIVVTIVNNLLDLVFFFFCFFFLFFFFLFFFASSQRGSAPERRNNVFIIGWISYRINTKKNHNRARRVFICDEDTCDFICEEVQFFGLDNINFQTFIAGQRIRLLVLWDIQKTRSTCFIGSKTLSYRLVF